MEFKLLSDPEHPLSFSSAGVTGVHCHAQIPSHLHLLSFSVCFFFLRQGFSA